MQFIELIREVGEWSQYNFGDQRGAGAFAPFAGMVEETGEIEAAVDELYADHTDSEFACIAHKVVDGHVDRLIYFADFCYRLRIGVGVSLSESDGLAETVPVALGKLAHSFLKYHQNIRGLTADNILRDAAVLLKSYVESYLVDMDIIDMSFSENNLAYVEKPLEEAVDAVWNVVKKRDWKKNPLDAHKVAEQIEPFPLPEPEQIRVCECGDPYCN